MTGREQLASLVVDITADSGPLKKSLTSMRGNLSGHAAQLGKSLGGALSKAFKASVVGGIGAAVAGALASKKFIAMANEQQEAEANLASVLEATGHAAGLTAEQMKAHASELQGVTRFGDEATIAMQAVLATFRNIKGDEFKRTTALIQDMSTVLGTDLKSSALQVGKALQDPVRGMSMLQRVGITFTEAQKEAAKQLWETGKQAEAQKIILDELAAQFGGAAAASAKTFGGQMEQLTNRFGDFQEKIGMALQPAIAALSKELTKGVAWLEKHEGKVKEWGESLAGAIKWIATIIGNMDVTWELLTKGAALALVKIKDNFVTAWDFVKAATAGTFEGLVAGFKELAGNFKGILSAMVGIAKAQAKLIAAEMKAAFTWDTAGIKKAMKNVHAATAELGEELKPAGDAFTDAVAGRMAGVDKYVSPEQTLLREDVSGLAQKLADARYAPPAPSDTPPSPDVKGEPKQPSVKDVLTGSLYGKIASSVASFAGDAMKGAGRVVVDELRTPAGEAATTTTPATKQRQRQVGGFTGLAEMSRQMQMSIGGSASPELQVAKDSRTASQKTVEWLEKLFKLEEKKKDRDITARVV